VKKRWERSRKRRERDGKKLEGGREKSFRREVEIGSSFQCLL